MSGQQGEGIETVLIQPDSGIAPVIGLITGAVSSIHIKQFTLDEPRIVDALIAAHERGVLVRVLLNPQRPSGMKSNEDIFRKFADHGMMVKWTSPKFAVTHEKSLLVDRSTALISTFNMSLKYFTQTRDFGVILNNPALVSEIGQCFDADWDEKDFTPDPALPLIWSTTNSRKKIAGFIDRARSTLDIQHPKLTDITILDRLLDAHTRGVKIRFLCGGAHGIQPWDICDTFSSWRALARAGVKINRMKHLKLHAKLLIADNERAIIGSMNLCRTAFDQRRELGIEITRPDIVRTLSATFSHDWEHSKHYLAPDPLDEAAHDEDDIPLDPDFFHD